MKFKIVIIVFLCLTFLYNTYFPSWLIVGSYKSNVETASNNVMRIYNNESLEIYEDGTFTEDFWGKGTWKLEHGFKGTDIIFEYGDESIHTYFYRRMFFSKPRIVLIRDLGTEFRKIN
jgi:hypothetical protein